MRFFISAATAIAAILTAAVQAQGECYPTLLPKPKPALHCGDTGTLSAAAVLSRSKTTAIKCRNLCFTTRTCLSYSFTKSTGNCQLYSKTIVRMGFKKSQNGVVYYSKLCYASPCKTLLDLNFEDGSWDPFKLTSTPSKNASYGVESPGATGMYAGTMTLEDSTNYVLLFGPLFPAQQGMMYTYSLDFKLNNAACNTRFGFQNGELFGFGPGGNDTFPINTWTSISTTFVGTSDTQVFYYSTSCATNSVGLAAEFDNILAVAKSPTIYTSTAAPTGADLVTEPHFDSGTTDAYNVYSFDQGTTVTATSPGYQGAQYALNFTFAGADKPSAVDLQQQLPSVRGTVYRTRLAYKMDTAFDSSCSVIMTLFNQDTGSSVRSLFVGAGQPTAPAGEWGLLEGIISSPTGADTFDVRVGCQGGRSPPLTMYIGEISVVPLS